jgi:hypothetical protein
MRLGEALDRIVTLEIILVDLVTEARHGLRFGPHFEAALRRADEILAQPDSAAGKKTP